MLTETAEKITESGYRSCPTTLLPGGSVLFTSRAPIGLVAIAGGPVCTNQGFKSFVPGPDVDSRYLYWWLRRNAPRIASRGSGSTFSEVSKGVVSRFQILLPPLLEQRRIAAMLDKADGVRRKRRESVKLLDEFLRSAYMAVVGPAAKGYDEWSLMTISDLAEPGGEAMRTGPFGSALRHSEFVDSGVAVLGIDNAVQNRFEWGERRFITPEKYEEFRRYTVRPGDVIVTIMGTTGRAAVVPDDVPLAISTKHLAVITVDQTKVHPTFLSYAVHSDPTVLAQISAANRGAIMSGLNLGIIKRLRVRLPPLSAQRRFAALTVQTSKSRGRAAQALCEVDALFNTLCHRSFQSG